MIDDHGGVAPPSSSASAVAVPDDIHVRGLSTGYADRRVIERLECTIPGGRVTAIVGANACGKSTLLRAIAGEVHLAAGRIAIKGRALKDY